MKTTILCCQHKQITLIGSEESGLKRAVCSKCRCIMSRRIEKGEYVYSPKETYDPKDDGGMPYGC